MAARPRNPDFVRRLAHVCSLDKPGKVAEVAGVDVETIRRYRNGASIPRARVLARLCDEFDISAEWLICGRGPETRQEAMVESIAAAPCGAVIGAIQAALDQAAESAAPSSACDEGQPTARPAGGSTGP